MSIYGRIVVMIGFGEITADEHGDLALNEHLDEQWSWSSRERMLGETAVENSLGARDRMRGCYQDRLGSDVKEELLRQRSASAVIQMMPIHSPRFPGTFYGFIPGSFARK